MKLTSTGEFSSETTKFCRTLPTGVFSEILCMMPRWYCREGTGDEKPINRFCTMLFANGSDGGGCAYTAVVSAAASASNRNGHRRVRSIATMAEVVMWKAKALFLEVAVTDGYGAKERWVRHDLWATRKEHEKCTRRAKTIAVRDDTRQSQQP